MDTGVISCIGMHSDGMAPGGRLQDQHYGEIGLGIYMGRWRFSERYHGFFPSIFSTASIAYKIGLWSQHGKPN